MALKIKSKGKKKDAAAAGPGKKAKKKTDVKVTKGRKAHFSLFVGDDGAILVFMNGNTVVRRLFAPTAGPEHTSTMVELMGQHPKAPVRVVMDVIDQQYVRQTFPPVSPLSVGGLVERRMKRDFPAEDLTGSIRIGREATARKDWIYLLVALSNTANFQQWVELMMERPNRLLGVYLLPLECERFISLLSNAMPEQPAERAPWQLLISHNKVSGFRIVVLRDGKLTFSRIGQAVGEAVPAVLAGNVEQEIQNTIEYIRRLGYAEGVGLEIYAILSAEVRDSIDPKRINASTLNLLSPYDVAEMLNLKQAALAADRFGDVVLAAALAIQSKQSMMLKPAYAKKLDQLSMARMALRGVAGIVVLSLLYLSVTAVVGVFKARSNVKQLEASLQQGEPTLQLLRRQVEQLGVDMNSKSDIVIFFDAVKPAQYSPIDMLPEVAKLQRNNVQIESWDWKGPGQANNSTEGTAPAPDASAPGGNESFPIKVEAKAQMLGNFPDSQTILEAFTNYKLYLSKAIPNYQVEIPSADISGGRKTSLAISASSKSGTTETIQPPSLNIVLQGPRTKASDPNAPNADPAGVAP